MTHGIAGVSTRESDVHFLAEAIVQINILIGSRPGLSPRTVRLVGNGNRHLASGSVIDEGDVGRAIPERCGDEFPLSLLRPVADAVEEHLALFRRRGILLVGGRIEDQANLRARETAVAESVAATCRRRRGSCEDEREPGLVGV